MKTIVEEIQAAITGRHPLLYLMSAEEDRVIRALEQLAPRLADDARVRTWTCVDGLEGSEGDTRSPVDALRVVLSDRCPGFYVFKDLPDFIESPEVVRALRNAYHTLKEIPQTRLVILSPIMKIPELLQKETCLIELSLPAPQELLDHVLALQDAYPGASLPEELYATVSLALRGLTLNEASHVMHRVYAGGAMGPRDILNEIFAEKELLLRKAGYLEYVPNRYTVDDIGGLHVLKDWAMKRRDLFTQTAVDAGLPVPRGILIMGISGCGKSMCAKAIASLWNVPLFRLDMNLVFSGLYGSPEAAFHRALKAIESVAPAVLWIDEVENALGMTNDATTAEQSLTFSTFLTWMQERPPLVFVAATANRIESLPAEIIRKGRFDEVFFCDLPGEEERREIIAIHLRNNGADLGEVPPERLLYATRGWSGAEIEQAIVSARIDAHQLGRPLTLDDIRQHTARMVPLSRTMEEQIKAIRSWSFNRAMKASRDTPRSMIPGAE
jgi:hypothetical protein